MQCAALMQGRAKVAQAAVRGHKSLVSVREHVESLESLMF
jgi:hypothetical protein